jgi:predicted peroxiredoxin
LTDSIFTFKPLKDSLVGDKLDQFKMEGEGTLYIIGNGLYVLDDPNEKMVKFRGFKFEKEEDAEKTIKYIAENLKNGKIVRVSVDTPIMIKNIYTLRVLEGDEIKIGTLGEQIKILSPLNAKQRYECVNGVWIGRMFKNGEEAKQYKKELKKKLEEIEPIDLKSVVENYK